MGNELNDKQALFANEYLKDLNATQAAIRAGYSDNLDTAKVQGSRLLTNDNVSDLIQKLFAERLSRTKIDADYVLNRLVEIDNMDILDIMNTDCTLKGLEEWPSVWRRFLTAIDISELFGQSGGDRSTMIGLIKKIKWPDKVKNLELIGKHIGVNAFSERREHNHRFVDENGNPMNMTINVKFVEPGGKGE